MSTSGRGTSTRARLRSALSARRSRTPASSRSTLPASTSSARHRSALGGRIDTRWCAHPGLRRSDVSSTEVPGKAAGRGTDSARPIGELAFTAGDHPPGHRYRHRKVGFIATHSSHSHSLDITHPLSRLRAPPGSHWPFGARRCRLRQRPEAHQARLRRQAGRKGRRRTHR